MFEIVLVAKCTLGCNLTKINVGVSEVLSKSEKSQLGSCSLVMDEAEADYEEELFDVEEISNIVKYSVDTSLSTCDYQNNKVSVHKLNFLFELVSFKVGPWVNSIVETSLSALTKLQKSYKYIGKMFNPKWKMNLNKHCHCENVLSWVNQSYSG